MSDSVGPTFGAPRPEDGRWMARALEQARIAALRDEVPVGAVVVRGGSLLVEAYNGTRVGPDPTAHAEVVALRRAARKTGDWRLAGCTLYVTLEPCAMCCGAMVLARVDRVVYAADDPKAGMASTLGNLLQDQRLNHRAELVRGVLEAPSADVLRRFFRARR